MESSTKAGVTTRVHEIYIKAPQEQIWEAITSPEWTAKYGYGAAIDVELKPGGKYRYTPIMAAATVAKFSLQGGGGWNWILSDLKSLLETGRTMTGAG